MRHPPSPDAGGILPADERAGGAGRPRDRGPVDSVQMIGMGYFPDEVGLAPPPDEA